MSDENKKIEFYCLLLAIFFICSTIVSMVYISEIHTDYQTCLEKWTPKMCEDVK